jgi:sulfate adenylyltransferase subunit 1 (EFTu-like GTPase family)
LPKEKGITIDVAYYFSTAKKSYIIADTRTRGIHAMVTGASTSQVSIILIDARKG